MTSDGTSSGIDLAHIHAVITTNTFEDDWHNCGPAAQLVSRHVGSSDLVLRRNLLDERQDSLIVP